MKKMFLLLAPVFGVTAVFSQTNREDVAIIQNLFGKEKKAIVAEFIQANPLSNDVFWGLYDQYELARKDLGNNRLDLMVKYVENYGNLTDAQTDELMNEIIAQQQSVEKLILTYYKKIKKEVGIKQAAQFYQLENYFLNLVRNVVFENIPFIGELELEEKVGTK
jgi:hypothetical protein